MARSGPEKGRYSWAQWFVQCTREERSGRITGIGFSGDEFQLGFDPNAFKTFRFESTDGARFTVAVDGRVFVAGTGVSLPGRDFAAFQGLGGCNLVILPRINVWGFVRYCESN